MPKEQIRKRGKRKPKNAEDDFVPTPAVEAIPAEVQPVRDEPPHLQAEAAQAGPSGIHPARAAFLAGRRLPPSDLPAPELVDDAQVLEWSRNQKDAEYPWGELDPDLKAYFRNVDEQIRDWEGVSSAGEEREGESIDVQALYRVMELMGRSSTVLVFCPGRAEGSRIDCIYGPGYRRCSGTPHAVAWRLGKKSYWRCVWRFLGRSYSTSVRKSCRTDLVHPCR